MSSNINLKPITEVKLSSLPAGTVFRYSGYETVYLLSGRLGDGTPIMTDMKNFVTDTPSAHELNRFVVPMGSIDSVTFNQGTTNV